MPNSRYQSPNNLWRLNHASLNKTCSSSFSCNCFGRFCHSTIAADTIKIGWLSSLTGALSSAAIAENQGVQLAVDEINKSGGILGRQIELLTRDTAGDPTKAVNFAQQLAFSDKVHFVIGPVNSGEGLAAVPILARAGVPNLVIGAIDELIDPVKYPELFALSTQTVNGYQLQTITPSKY
jgi:branched-chain amino acid transport system substrate-binding protein